LLGLLLGISVGPVIFSILKQSLNNGHRGGYSFIAGVAASDITIVVICNLFTRLFDTAMKHELIIGVAGSCLLVALGIYNFFFRKVQTADDGMLTINNLRKRDIAGIFFSGYFMNTLNPGAFLFWFAATATITADSRQMLYPDQYRLIVFVTALLFNFSADISKVLLANRIRAKLTPHNVHIINRISGAMLIVFAIVIVVTMFLRGSVGSQV
jgi:threonine/homoserine/homoserine lactone efflux protein